MELMRHSDRKLTDKIYTDSNLLPIGEVIRKLPDDESLIKMLTEIPGTDRQILARIRSKTAYSKQSLGTA